MRRPLEELIAAVHHVCDLARQNCDADDPDAGPAWIGEVECELIARLRRPRARAAKKRREALPRR